MERRLPSDLITWLGITNGVKPRGGFGNLLPVLFNPLPCDEMLRERAMLRGVYADWERPGELEPAGTPSTAWLDSFLPIADSGTDVWLFADLRDGDLHGSVGAFDCEGDFELPKWMSITEMLADVADALALNQPALQDHGRRRRAASPWSTAGAWKPYVDDGRLRWNLVEVDDQRVTEEE